MHHQKADIDRLHVKRKEGGRGLVKVGKPLEETRYQIFGLSNLQQHTNI
jgi:hypothetical protein